MIQWTSIRPHFLAVRVSTALVMTVPRVVLLNAKARTAWLEPAWALNAAYAIRAHAEVRLGAARENTATVAAGVTARNPLPGAQFV